MTPMHKEWIDNASYEELLRKWRFEPIGSPWFQGELGKYFEDAFFKKRAELDDSKKVAASKSVGWDT